MKWLSICVMEKMTRGRTEKSTTGGNSEKRLTQRKQDTTNKNKYEQLLGTVLLKILHFLSELKMLKRTRG